MRSRLNAHSAASVKAGVCRTRHRDTARAASAEHGHAPYEAALRDYEAASAAQRPGLLAHSPVIRTLPFFAWLAEHTPHSPSEAAAMQQLSGELLALRRRVPDAASLPESCAQEAQDFALAAVDPAGLQTHAWTPEREAQLLQQAEVLRDAMRQRQAAAAAALTGRADVSGVDGAELHKRLAHVTAARRILDFLLTEEDREARRGTLPDAFTPPPPAAPVGVSSPAADGARDAPSGHDAADGTDDGDEGEDELYTTPMQLLQAIRQMQRELQRSDAAADARALPGDSPAEARPVLLRRLRELHQDVNEYWLAEGAAE